MSRQMIVRTASMLVLALSASGCAHKTKQTIAMLEQNNRDLTERLNSATSERNVADERRDELDRQLQAALREAQQCRAQLTARVEPEEAAPGWTAVPGGAMIAIEGSVLFAPGKTDVRDQARKALDAIVSTVRGEYGDKDIIVFGHTDDQPIKKSGWEDNWQLSAERALAVVRYIQEHGISPDRLIAGGCGEHRPRVAGRSQVDRAANRRVEIFALDARAMTAGP